MNPFPPDGGVMLQRTYSWVELAAEVLDVLGPMAAFCLAGLAYVPELERTMNPLLHTKYGRIMLRLDPETRKHLAKCIMQERCIRIERQSGYLIDLPSWWIDSHANPLNMLRQT